jgi:4-amino-4-deoxy-L-arabinose transferase
MFWMMAVFIAVQLPKIEALSRKYINIIYLIIISLLCSAVIIFWILDFSLIKSTFFASLIALGILIFSLLTYYLLDNSKSYKPAIMAAVFGACLVLLSSAVLRVNSPVINSTRDIGNFINHVSPGLNKTIIVDDHLLPSLTFYTRAQIITLKDERNTTNRETQFENDNNWEKTLWDLNDSGSITKLDSLSRKSNDFLLISKKQGVQPQLNFLKTRYNSKKEYPKWKLFYNK